MTDKEYQHALDIMEKGIRADERKKVLNEVYDRIDEGLCDICKCKDIDNRCYKNCTMEVELIKEWLEDQMK